MSAKIQVLGNACVVTSSLTLEQIKTLEKYRPNALTLSTKEDDGIVNTYFTMGTGDKAKVGTHAVVFNESSRDDAKKATATILLPDGIKDIKAYVAEQYGAAITNINKVEAAYEAVAKEISEEREAILGAITVA